MKYTKEILSSVVERNVSVAGVIRDLGLHQSGGNHSHISNLIRKFDLDISHFSGRRTNSGTQHKGGVIRELILGAPSDQRVHGRTLRRSLLKLGRENKCGYCGLKPEWNGKPLLLIPDHMNGKFWDNRPENLMLSCPNCHSQTLTFSGRNNKAPLAELADA